MPHQKIPRTIEEEVIISSPDKKNIYVTIGHPSGKPKGMVVFVHGLASTALWPTMLLGSHYFRTKGYAYCRINLYDWRPNARTLMTSDLLQHSKDTDTVVKYLRRRNFSTIFAIGHSFGGLVLLQSNTAAFCAMSLWDCSSFISHPPERWLKKDKATGATYLVGGCELLMPKRYVKGMERFPNELELISEIEAPCQICYAGGKDGVLVESSKRYFKHLNQEKELVAIPHASHSFTEEGISEVLFDKTKRWFQQQLKRRA